MKAFEKFKDKGVVFLSLTDEGADKKAETEKFLKQHKMTWPTGYGSQVTEDYGVQGYPTVFVVGTDGKVVWNDNLEGGVEAAVEKALKATGK